MAKEIERKFKVRSNAYIAVATDRLHIQQAYLARDSEGCTVRIRIVEEKAFLTIKSVSTQGGLLRNEWEYPIPLEDAKEMIVGKKLITKERFLVPYEGHTWEVDCFSGSLEGLVIAEVELKSMDEPVALPPWVGEEVTGLPAYYNASLVEKCLPLPTTEK